MLKVKTEWNKFGTIIVREYCIELDAKEELKVDHCIFVAGWEERALNSKKQLNFDIPAPPGKLKQITIFDFELTGLPKLLAEKQAKTLKSIGSDHLLPLRQAYNYSQNFGLMKSYFHDFKNSEINSVYIDITTMPKYYVQALSRFLIEEDVFSRIYFGYSPGVYTAKDFNEVKAGKVEFPVIENFRSQKPIREKQLTLVLGGERSNCYSLISKIGPDRIDIFKTVSDDYPGFYANNQMQIEKIRSEFGDRLGNIFSVNAFSVLDFMKKYSDNDFSNYGDYGCSTFVASTKVLALASGLLGASQPYFAEVRARKSEIRNFPPRVADGRHFVFEVVSLDSPKLAALDIW